MSPAPARRSAPAPSSSLPAVPGGTAFGGVKGRSELPGYVEKYLAGEIEVDRMVTHTMPLADINRAFDLMHEGKSIRSVILFD